MIKVRKYQSGDLESAALVISNAAGCFMNCDGTPDAIREYVGFYAPKPENIENLKLNFSLTPIIYVAEDQGKIVGVIRGRGNRLSNFFVIPSHQSRGVGRKLFQEYEKQCIKNRETEIKVRASVSSVPVYKSLGFKKTTGLRARDGLFIQPMTKFL